MADPQPEALRLADYLEQDMSLTGLCDEAAAELRRLAAECEALRADAERLNAIEAGLLFVEPRYQEIPATWQVGKAERMSIGKTLRAAIDAAMKASHD